MHTMCWYQNLAWLPLHWLDVVFKYFLQVILCVCKYLQYPMHGSRKSMYLEFWILNPWWLSAQCGLQNSMLSLYAGSRILQFGCQHSNQVDSSHLNKDRTLVPKFCLVFSFRPYYWCSQPFLIIPGTDWWYQFHILRYRYFNTLFHRHLSAHVICAMIIL